MGLLQDEDSNSRDYLDARKTAFGLISEVN
jgi:hypothetical protein